MRRTTLLLVPVALVLLLDAPEARGGGGLADLFLGGRITGPALSATIVIDPTADSPTKGKTAVRFQKGTSSSGAVFSHETAAGWVLGCDGTKGASAADPNFNIRTLTNLRFGGKALSNWMPDGVISALLFGSVQEGGLGLTVNPATPHPGITDIDNPVCTTVIDEGVTKYILSFTALIQFAETAQ